MNKQDEKERTQRAFRRAFNNANRRWQFNGRTFETGMEIYRGNVWIRAMFESSPAGVTVWVHVGRAFNQMLDVNSPPLTFRGENAMTDALNDLAERIAQTIDKVQELEREALKQIKPEISAESLWAIFENPDRITA